MCSKYILFSEQQRCLVGLPCVVNNSASTYSGAYSFCVCGREGTMNSASNVPSIGLFPNFKSGRNRPHLKKKQHPVSIFDGKR